MSNTVTWLSPDNQQAASGNNQVIAAYLIDPTSNKAYAASGGGGGSTSDITSSGNLTTTSGAGSTVSIAFGSGQATWEAQLTGTFSSGTTIVFEGSDDNTNWFATYGVNVTLANPAPISSVSGPGPFLVRGVSSGYQNFRVRCSALHSGDNVAVILIGSAGTSGNGGLATNDGTFAKETGGNLASILSALQGILSTNVVDLSTTGTISVAQPSINTPVSNATVVLTVGQGQSTWKAQLLAGGGGFTSGTTIVADKSPDGGTTWYSASFKVSGASPNTPVSSVVGPGPLELTGTVAGVNRVRIRCSVLNSTETVAVTLRASAGISEVGIISSIPAGTNSIGTVNIGNANTNGQATMANSAPVVLASDEVVPVQRSAVAVYSRASAASSGSTQNSGDLPTGPYTEIALDITTTAQSGTSPTIQFFYERKAADGNYYVLWQSAVLTAASNVLSTSIGAGMAYNQSLGATGRLRWVVGGSATPTFTFSANIQGK